jgi:hypothetical protein
MDKIKHTEAANLIGCTRNHINYLITKGYIERLGYGHVSKESVENFIKNKDKYPIQKKYEGGVDTKDHSISTLWAKILDLTNKVNLLIKLFDTGLEEIEMDDMRAEYLFKGAFNYNAKELNIKELSEWASICIQLSLDNLMVICEKTQHNAWYYFYRLCTKGLSEAKVRSNAELLLLYKQAKRNIHELCLLMAQYRQEKLSLKKPE